MEISDWQTSCKVIKKRGDHLLKQKHWADCSFLVGSDENASIVWAHKLILAMASPVFEAMFYGKMAETSDNIRISDINQDIFEKMLEYIYADKFNIKSIEDAFELSYCAKKYMLPHLLNSCTKVIYSQLSTENACRAYEFGMLYDNKNLVKKSLQIIIDNTTEVLSMTNFSDITVSTIITIFDQPTLNIDNEMVLLEAAAKYAEVHNIVLNGETSPESIHHRPKELSINETNSTSYQSTSSTSAIVNSSPSLREAVQKIRFLTLTPSLFAGNEASRSLLTNNEMCSILMNISSPSCGISMPEGFSTSKEMRNKNNSEFTEESNSTDDDRLDVEPLKHNLSEMRDYKNCILRDLIYQKVSQGRLDKAEILCMQMSGQGDQSYIADMYSYLALLFWKQKNYTKAIDLLEVAKSLLIDRSDAKSSSLNNLAAVYYAAGKYKEAESIYMKVVSKFNGYESEVCQFLCKLGVICAKLYKYDEADCHYRKALGIYERKLGKNHPKVAEIKNQLANIYLKKCQALPSICNHEAKTFLSYITQNGPSSLHIIDNYPVKDPAKIQGSEEPLYKHD